MSSPRIAEVGGVDERIRAAVVGRPLFVVMSNAQCGRFSLIMTIVTSPHKISNPS
jgi:hypothetical protein